MPKNNERGLIFEEVRKAQGRLNRAASTSVLSGRDGQLLSVLTEWMRNELATQAIAYGVEERLENE